MCEEERPHPALAWRALVWLMHRRRKKAYRWHVIGMQLQQNKCNLDVASLSKNVKFNTQLSWLPPDDVVRDFRSKRHMLTRDFGLEKLSNGLWSVGPAMVPGAEFTTRELWIRAHVPITRNAELRKWKEPEKRRTMTSLMESSEKNLVTWKRRAETIFGCQWNWPGW